MSSYRVDWKAIRITSQWLAAALFICYFLQLVYPLHMAVRPDLVFQLDPLKHLYLLLSQRQLPEITWAVIALCLLFAVSRLFCGWLCPVGALLDTVSALRASLVRNPCSSREERQAQASRRTSQPHQLLPANIDVYFLCALLVLAVFGNPLLWVFDPLVFAFKFLTVIVLPITDAPLRYAFNTLDSRFYQAEWWHPVMDGYSTYFTAYQAPVYADTTLIILLAATIIGLELLQKRFWCRYICPLGALLRLSYLLHPLKRRILPDCAYCLKCEVSCHFGGQPEQDCLYCMECIHRCDRRQITFLPAKAAKPSFALQMQGKGSQRQSAKVDQAAQVNVSKGSYRAKLTGHLDPQQISRRQLLRYAVAGAAAYPILNLFDRRTELPVDFIRPPGVMDEARFTDLCIKCGQCLKVCLTNGLQPSLVESGLSGLWTPRLISRLGYCEWNCNLCGQVCPTLAIPKLTLEVKQRQVLGLAFIDRSRCIPYILPSNCTVCEEFCPTPRKAILLHSATMTAVPSGAFSVLQPYVVPEDCIGCGICENVCPLPGLAAIRVLRQPSGTAFAGPSQASDSVPYPGYGAY